MGLSFGIFLQLKNPNGRSAILAFKVFLNDMACKYRLTFLPGTQRMNVFPIWKKKMATIDW